MATKTQLEKALQLTCEFIDGWLGECPVSHFEEEPLPAEGRFSFQDCDKNCGNYESRDKEGGISCVVCWRDWFLMKGGE